MKKKLYIILIALIVALTATALVGCDSKENSFALNAFYCAKLNEKVVAKYSAIELTVTTAYGEDVLTSTYTVEKEDAKNATITYTVEKFVDITVSEGQVVLPEETTVKESGKYFLVDGIVKDEAGNALDMDLSLIEASRFNFDAGSFSDAIEIYGGFKANVTKSKTFCGITTAKGANVHGMTVKVYETEKALKEIVIDYTLNGAKITYDYNFR